jgi:REP element-mobilizing transposase RayT
MAYTQILYHIVLRTKWSEPVIAQENVSSLYKYIWGIIKNKKGILYRINGIEDHIHILSDLHPGLALADYVKSIKVATSLWMKQNPDFPLFRGWEEGYAAFTYSYKEKDVLVNYIKNQQKHHLKENTQNELKRLWIKNGMKPDERYFVIAGKNPDMKSVYNQ